MLVFSIDTSDLAANLTKLPNFIKGQFKLKQFVDGEWYARVTSKVGGKRTVVIGNSTAPADNIIKLTLLVNALRHAGAGTVDLVIPYFGYQKQDKVVEPGEAVSAEAMALLLRAIKPDRLICNALHSEVTRKLLKSKLTEMTPAKLLASAIKKLNLKDIVVASPDKGSLKRDLLLAYELGKVPTICAEKERTKSKVGVKNMSFHSKNLNGSDVILADDFVQSGGTIVEAVKNLRANGAGKICLVLYHGFLYQQGFDVVANLNLQKVIMTDTLPVPDGKNIKVVGIAAMLAKALA